MQELRKKHFSVRIAQRVARASQGARVGPQFTSTKMLIDHWNKTNISHLAALIFKRVAIVQHVIGVSLARRKPHPE